MYASVAQSVEQGTENPCVGGSIPPRGTICFLNSYYLVLTEMLNNNIICWCGSTVEQLTCNQQVVGSIPITSSIFLGRLQSGQMQRTVNPSTQSSMVRIHPFPPQNRVLRLFFCCSLCLLWVLPTSILRIPNHWGSRVPARQICYQYAFFFYLLFLR